jgi:glycosyltransferase involved in cell wall biosynthesis
MENGNDLVTIVMPVFNAELHLKEAIDSIITQTYSNFEFLIINDGSTDSSNKIILSYSDTRIRYINNEKNKGLIETLNLGFSVALGKYIARMDADDISLRNRIEQQVNFLNKNPQIGLLGTGYTYFGDKNDVVQFPTRHEDLKYACLFYNPFCHPSVMIRKEVLDTFELKFKKEYLHSEEYKLWTDLLSFSHGANLNDNLLLYRSHPTQVSQVHLLQQIENSKKIRMEYLMNAGFDHTDMNIELILGESYEILTSDEVFEKMKYLQKLADQNDRIEFFTIEKWQQELSKRYKNSLLELKIIDGKIYNHYKKSKLSEQIKWTFRQKIHILFKRLSTIFRLK